MAGKTVLVTGGTGGIGAGHRRRPRRLGARVGITGRDRSRAEAAAGTDRATGRQPVVDVFAADLSSQAEVRRLAAEVLAAYPRLDVLVNNVGGFWATRHITARRAGAHLRRQPPGAVPADQPAAGPAPGQRAGAGRHRLLRRAGHGPDRLRRPAGRPAVLRPARLQPVQARQRHVHLRACPPARRAPEITATVLHPGVVRTAFGRKTPAVGCASCCRSCAPVHEEPRAGCRAPRSTWRPRPRSRA